MSPVHRSGPGGGYWYYVVPAIALLLLAIAALTTHLFGLEP